MMAISCLLKQVIERKKEGKELLDDFKGKEDTGN
jgi:hypothetical protein